MVKASKGFRRRTRRKLKVPRRRRGLQPITRYLERFEIGEKASVRIDQTSHKGMPHPRFQGKTGTIIGMQGRAYLLEITDGRKKKILIARPEHLRRV